MDRFRAFRIHQVDGHIEPRLETLTLDDLSPGDVVIRGEWSSINYKDALAATGRGRILRRFPLVGGVDIAGEVLSSADPRFRAGDRVAVLGCGLSETHDGGFSEIARVPGEWVIPLPGGINTRTAMAIGTAGFTAALAVHRLERNDQHPGLGPMLVTGATGGVGSMAVSLLADRGYEVVALTGKPEQAADYLGQLGARRLLDRNTIEMGRRPLEKIQWGGAVDNLGGEVLAWLTRTTAFHGNIASIGLAAGTSLETTVMPFILRGVSLLGINAVELPRSVREEVWARLAGDLAPAHLELIVQREVSLESLPGSFEGYMDGSVTGRTVVRLS
ncbi:MAG: oxidoreductase [Chromatiales bacterium]|nr:oxidoreductase [Chromatiales bacterium]